MSAPEDPWPDRHTKTLVDEWLKGTPTRQIARLIGTTVNAVTGKAHRLYLPKRQNPVAPRKPVPKATPKQKPAAPKARPRPCPPAPAKAPEPEPPTHLGTHACQWPLWGDEPPTHEFCGERVKYGSSYCPDHHARATVKRTPRWAA